MIHVVATIDVAAGRRAQFLEEFHKLVPTVRAEQGCLEYGPTVNAEAAITEDRPDTVVVIEKWTDLPALEAHLEAQHMVDFRERVKPLVEGTKLQVLRPA